MTASTIEGRILEAFLVFLQGWGVIPVVYGNLQYPKGKAKDDQYAILSYSPGTPVQVVIDPADGNRHMGILGVSIMTLLNSGEMDGIEIGGDLASYFQGQVLSSGSTTVRITARPRVAGGYVDGDRWRTPVTIPFETISV